MGKSSKTQKAEKSRREPEEEPKVVAPPPEEKKRDKRSKKVAEVAAPAPAPVPVPEPVEPEVVPKIRTRRVVDRETILDEFDSILTSLEAEIETMRNDDGKKRTGTGIKYLRNVLKRVKGLRSDSSRVLKTRKTGNRPKNTTSGFMKPVNISKQMSNFTGWPADKMVSRVDVTKFICEYIKRKDLQKPEDRRIIIPDRKLRDLLSIAENDTNNLTYYNLQQKIQPHFSSSKVAVV